MIIFKNLLPCVTPFFVLFQVESCAGRLFSCRLSPGECVPACCLLPAYTEPVWTRGPARPTGVHTGGTVVRCTPCTYGSREYINQHIEAMTKWPPCSRRHFQIHFLQWKVRINHISALVPIMAWRRPGDKPSSGPMMVSLLTYIGVTRPHWVNTQWHDVSRDLGSHFEWRYLAEKVSGNHRQPTTFHWKYSFEVIIGSADALPQLGATALVVTIMIQFRSLYINDWLIPQVTRSRMISSAISSDITWSKHSMICEENTFINLCSHLCAYRCLSP